MEKRIIETVLACAALTWGVWLMLPFATFQSSPTFAVMDSFAPEWVWGLLMAGAGLQCIVGIWLDSAAMRQWALMEMALLWLASWVALLLANWRSTTTVHYIWWFILCAYSYLRVARNGGQH